MAFESSFTPVQTESGVELVQPGLRFRGAVLHGVLFSTLLYLNTAYAMPLDTDGDGVPDTVEAAEGTQATDAANYLDSDGDGLPDYTDWDSDGDSVPDLLELGADPYLDADGDGVPVYLDDADDDSNIGNSDGRVQSAFDPDGNGLPAFQDDTHDHLTDTDGDGVSDSMELAEMTDPYASGEFLDTDGDGTPDAIDGDSDNDGRGNMLEAGVFPYYDRDCDGVPAYLDDDDYRPRIGNNDGKVQRLFDPDIDGVASFQDSDDPRTDSDGDGVPDAVEIAQGTIVDNAGSFLDSDADGIPDFTDEDDDNDSIPDFQEGDADLDSDGLALSLIHI